MAQHVRVLPVLSEDQSLIPNIHTGWFTTSCNSLDLGHLLPSSGLCGKLHSYAYTHMCTHTQIIYIFKRQWKQFYSPPSPRVIS